MIRRSLVAIVLLCACEKTPPSTPPDGGDAVAGDDAGEDVDDDDDDGDDGDDDAAPAAKKPDPVQHVLEIDGPVTKAEIDKQVQDHLNAIRECYDDALKHPDGLELGGAIVVRLTVSKAGEVTSAIPELSEFNHPPTEKCLAAVAEHFVLPKHKAESTVRLPFYMNVL